MSNKKKITAALEVIYSYGQSDGDHHKAWVIDQVVRILTASGYDKWVADYKNTTDPADTYDYYTGIIP